MRVAIKIGAICMIVLTYSYLFVIGMISAFEPTEPHFDTRYSEKYNEGKFHTIEIGADTSLVIYLIGRPINIHSLGNGTEIWEYSQDGKCDDCDAWLKRELFINENGKVDDILARVSFD